MTSPISEGKHSFDSLLRKTKNKRILVKGRMQSFCFPERTAPLRKIWLRAQQSVNTLFFKMMNLLPALSMHFVLWVVTNIYDSKFEDLPNKNYFSVSEGYLTYFPNNSITWQVCFTFWFSSSLLTLLIFKQIEHLNSQVIPELYINKFSAYE